MSYDLFVYVNEVSDSAIPQWLDEMRKFNIDVEIHPDFSFEEHSGFLPLKVVVYDCPNSSLNQMELLTGFEIWVNDNHFKESTDESVHTKIKESEKCITFMAGSQNSFEFRIAWYSAVSLAKIYNGILTDPQEGLDYEGEELIKTAFEKVNHYEKSISNEQWKYYEFKEWIG